jgi:REP element-mobilizing transposase RayT
VILRLKQNLPPLFDPRDDVLRNHFFQLAQKYHIKIFRLVFNHTHIHAVVLLRERQSYVGFIRELTGFIPVHLTKSLSIPGLVFRKIFSTRPLTRAIPWGRVFRTILNYMKKNELESGEDQTFLNRQCTLRFQTNAQLIFALAP